MNISKAIQKYFSAMMQEYGKILEMGGTVVNIWYSIQKISMRSDRLPMTHMQGGYHYEKIY